MAVRRVFGRDPNSQQIFRAEKHERTDFDQPEEDAISRLERGHGFERHRDEVDHDQRDEKPPEEPARAIANGALLENLIKAPPDFLQRRMPACHRVRSFAQALPSAASMAASAASAFEPSGPPACAISGRPPPPLPPNTSEP
jgi:hypothetical protein